MRTGSSDVQFQGHRGRIRPDARPKKARKSRYCFIDLEGLESRTLLATIPGATAATINGMAATPVNLTSYFNATPTSGGNANSPTVAINPYDSQEVVAVWGIDISNLVPTPLTTARVELSYSVNGGASWSTPSDLGVLPDPALYTPTAPTPPYVHVTEPSVGFDSQGNFYVLDLMSNAVTPAPTSGAVTLSKFSFIPGTGVGLDFSNKIIDQWVNGPADVSPIIAVDAGTYPNSGPGTTPPAGSGLPNDPNANKVYIAWATNDINLADPLVLVPFSPNRAELLVSSDGGVTFSGETYPDATNNVGPELDTHPQLVINSNASGQVTVAWEDFGTASKAAPPYTYLESSSVTPGASYSSTPLPNSTGIIGSPVTGTDPRGNWTSAIYGASSSGNSVIPTAVVANQDVNGDQKNDIVVADQPATGTSLPGIGVLINAGAGTFPANATFTNAGSNPSSVAVGNFILNPSPPPAPATTADAAVADDNALGGVTIIPSDGAGNFTGAQTYVSTAPYTVAVASGNFNGAGASIVAVSQGANQANPSIDILPHDTVLSLVNVPIPAGDLAGMLDPRAVVIGDFNGDGVQDFAVLSGNDTNGTSDFVTVFVNTTISGGPLTFANVSQFNVGPGAVAMATGNLTGSATFSDLAIVFNTVNTNDLEVLQNTSSAAVVSFVTHTITGSIFAGTAVGVATGTLSTGGAYTTYQDIAVVYAATGGNGIPVNESMVAVFQNAQIGFGFPRTPVPVTGGDYNALQTNPTAITVANLSGAGGTWNSIVVTNNDDALFGGSVSVLAPIARPTPPTIPFVSDFQVDVNVPNPALITDLTATLEVTDTALADLKIELIAPDGTTSITLVDNQNIYVGTTTVTTSHNIGITGSSMGIFDYSPGPPTIPGFPVGTIFDDTATRDIVDLNPIGLYGAGPPLTSPRGAETDYIGHWRPESDFINGETLADFVQQVIASGQFNGVWTLRITDQIPKDFGQVQKFNLDFSTGQPTGPVGQIASQFIYPYTATDGVTTYLNTIVVPGALGNSYPTAAPSVPNFGVGPGMVLAEDNTLGPNSEYQGRIYAAFVGYFNDSNPRTIVNPTTNTDIFLVYSDDGGASWSAPELINNDQAVTDGFSQANDSVGPTGSNQFSGRTQFQPEIAVDQATGTVVLSWRDARDDAANARVATYITTSIDGGQTFGPQTYANPQKTAVDSITGQTNVIGPASDNQSGGNAQTDAPFGYGTQMGLAVFDGQLYPIWAGNFYGPNPQIPLADGNLDSFYNTSTGAVNGYPLNIWYQPMVIASGPRIVSSTMGPVVAATVTGTAADLPQFIPPPPNVNGTTTSTLAITGDPSLNVASLEVTLSLIYPTDGNLTITLISPPNLAGVSQSVILYQNPNDTGQDFTDTTFSDSATQSITTATAPYTGTFQPLQPLSAFDGLQAFGNWQLQITGGVGSHGGILQSWSLSINGVASKPTSFEVTFDRPIDPLKLLNLGEGTFTAADVQVLYHDTNPNTAADPPISLMVTNVVPVQPDPTDNTDPAQNGKDGYTKFLVYFNPDELPNGSPSGITDYTGTYSYVIAPDNGSGTAISAPIGSWRETPVAQPVISPSVSPNLPIPTWGPGGSNTIYDETISTITLAGYNNQIISGLTVNLNITDPLTPPGLGNDGDLFIELVAPNGATSILYYKPGDTNQNFTNVTFSDAAAQSILLANGPYTNGTYQPYNPLAGLNGSAVNGTYQLIIDNYSYINSGTLLNWSITLDSTKLKLQYHTGTAMDQNADGTSDQNPLTTPFTGLTPGDAYIVPTPQPTAPFTFNDSNILSLTPPFDQNTLPLIMPGPYVMATSVPNGTGSDNLVLNGTNSSMNVTFDRPMQVSTFTPDQVLQIMGPIGSISAPQSFPSDSVGQTIPAATSTGPGTLSSTLTIPSYDGTFKVADITVQLSAAFQPDSNLTAELIAPDGTIVPLFSGVGGAGANFINTVLDDSAETSITTGTAPFTGTYQPTGKLSSLDGATVDIQNAALQWVSGVWKLVLTNSSKTATGTLDAWSLNITPMISVTPVNPVKGLATTFTIGFPQQELSGTYTLQIGPGVTSGTFPLDAAGDPVNSSLNAGLEVLRGGSSTSPVTTVRYTAADLPKVIPAPVGTTAGMVTSTIIVPDNFLVQGDTTSSGVSGLRVTLKLTYPTDPDLTLTLQHYGLNGELLGSVPLASGVGNGPTTANFNNTIFDDNATTPIQDAGAPFFATYNPQMPLSAFAGMTAQGTWVLVIQNNSTSGGTGTVNSWSLSFQKPVPSSGLGVPGADNINTSFRIFTLGQADAMSAEAWTAVGPASISAGASAITITGPSGSGESTNAGRSGRVTGLAVDSSDLTGNTVYAAGASGGVWKTTDFLTTSPAGPTWIPLTDFGPSNAINIGSITVFPRNDNVNQTVIIAATGEGNTGTAGVGFLISTDGGATWTLDDSSVNVDSSGNPLPIETTTASLERNRTFVGDTSYQVVVDPKLSPSGQVIIYAALSGPTGGIWRSEDTGQHWVNMLPGQATSVVLDPESGAILNPDTDTTTQGNLQVVYAGIRGVGVEMSPNQGQIWALMSGGIGNPLIFNYYNAPPTNVNPSAGPTPNGAQGRIVLAVPNATGNAAQDPIYEGWLYAAVANPAGGFYGLFVTKDFGENWTQVRIPTLAQVGANAQAIPNNNVGNPDYPITGGAQFAAQGNYDLTLAVDPTDPSVVYLGGSADGGQTALARVDLTNIWDAHSLVPYSNFSADGGTLNLSSTGPATITSLKALPPVVLNEVLGADPTYYENFIRNPQDPFLVNSTLDLFDYSSFTNNGAGVTWIPFDPGGTDYHAVTTMVDPLTGLPRLIFGNDQGVWTILDNNGTFETQVGTSASGVQLGSPTDQLASVDRNGNLQITQFYYGATQPSTAAAQLAGALFYGSAQDDGGPVSAANILTTGNITWNGPGGDAAGVGTDQQGLGSAYQFFWPCCGGNYTDFFQYIAPGLSGAGLGFAGQASGGYVSRTFGLLQASGNQPTPDPQWPFEGGANFAINPVNSADVVISSSVGRIFTTFNQGVTWFDVGDPGIFGSPGNFSLALAYGAPDPTAPEGVGNLGNFIYVGTSTGQIYVTQDGGGNGTSNNWINISTGLNGAPVRSITTDPTRGSHDAYAVTTTGVFYMANSIASASNPTPTWVNITSNIHNLAYSIFGQNYNPTTDANSVTLNQALSLSSIIADWRYQIPNNPNDPADGYHPVLYVGAGNSFRDGSGVYQSLNNGATWTLFPSTTYGAVAQGGDLPNVPITDLNVSLGNVDTNTGRPSLAGPYQTFVFAGTLTSGSPSVTGINYMTGLAAGENIVGTGIPAGTTILAVSSSTDTITLSANATATGSQSLAAANPTAAPDPDLLLATTYGRGQFAINLNPLILGNAVTVTPTTAPIAPSTLQTVTGPVTFSGSSEISAFGNTTWITIEDVTNPAKPTIIAGFNPATAVSVPSSSNSTNALGNFSIPFDPASYFTSNGVKTIEVFATDDAGSVGNVVTYTFTLNDSSLPQPPPPPPTGPPTVTLALSTSAIKGTTSGTFTFIGTLTSGSASVTGISSTTGLAAGQTVSGPGIPSGTTIQTVNSTNFTGTLTSGSMSVTGISSTTGLFVGETITGIGIPSGTTIQTIDTATATITLSSSATVSDTQNLTAIAVTLSAPATSSGTSITLTITSPITISVTNQSTPTFTGTVTVGATVEIYEYEQDTLGAYDILVGAPFTPTIAANGSFSFLFSNPLPIENGNFEVYAVASYTNYPLIPATTSNIVYMQIDNTTPVAVTDFRLNPSSDTGIVGDNVTSDHTPYFIGTAPAGDTIELIQAGTSTVQRIAIAQSTTSHDINGNPYDFSIQFPNAFGDGQITLQVIVIDAFSGNASGLSNPATVTIVSIASDYNGDSYSDAALYSPSTTSAGQWLAKTTTEVPTTFIGTLTSGSNSVTGISSTTGLVVGETVTGTGIPSGTTIQTINSLTATITLSANATVSSSESLTAPAPPAFWFTSGTTFPTAAQFPVAQFPTAADLPTTDGVPFQGDFDGDGQTDLAFYDLSTATWYMDDSKQGLTAFVLGTPNSSVPVVGYFNANAPEEPAVYTVVNGQGTWSIASGHTGLRTVLFGQAGDIPVPGDYTGVGYDELAVYRPSTGQFLVQLPGTTTFSGTLTSGSNSVTGISSTTGLVVGETVTGTGIPSGTTIQTINSLTATITLSANATVSGSQSLAAPAPLIISLAAGTPDLSSLVPVPGNYNPYSTTFTGTLMNGSASVTGISSTTGLVVGQTVTGTGIPSGTTIQTIDSSTATVTLSANATASGSQSLIASTTFTGTLTSGSASVTGLSSTTGLFVGEPVTGTGIPYGTTIQTINSLTATITLSANATVSGSQSLTASGWIENTEAAWYDPTTGVYTIQGPSTNTNPSGVYTVSAGFQAGDIPVPADYSGSGSTQAVVFRPSTGDFFAAGNPVPIATFAQASGDIPLAAPLSYRVPDPPSTGTGGSTGTGTGSTGTGTGGSTGTGTGGSTGTGSTGTGTGGSTGTGTGGSSGTGSTGTGSGGTGSGSSSGTTSSSPPAQSPTSGNSGTGSHKKKASHPAPKPSHAKKPVKHVQKKATPPAKPKPKVQVHVVSHPAHKVVKVSPLSTSAQKHAHMVDLALQDIHVNLLRKKSHG